jgi:(1->4)-alpha-D-glucan 1-alpha-D-glucosylmutase
VVVEKILARGEDLPEEWPANGTTGYDYVNVANGIFVDPEGAGRVEEIYSTFIGRKQDFSDILYHKKKLVMNTLLGVEMRTLGRQLAELASQDRYARELERIQLIDALIEVTACLGVYRTYIRNMELPAHATKYIEEAVTAARARAPHLSAASFNFVHEVLLLLNPPHVLADQREARLDFVMRWQQFTGPIVAKGFEDTALYVYYPLLSLNEVGGNPRPSQASTVDEFYAFLEKRRIDWPGTLDASSTHDTKRSEDVRARINVLSEMPEEWQKHLELWSGLNAQYKQQAGGVSAPDRNEEYFLYQTLLGVWPLDREADESLIERVQAHLVKATREAMVHTRWTRPNQPHEDALQKFVAGILSSENREFLDDFRRFQEKIAYFGMVNGLSQTLLKIAAPGVADFYQGSELWDLRLVDPDNRGAIDFARRETALKEIESSEGTDIKEARRGFVEHWQDGKIKLYLIRKALRFRRDHGDLFHEGEFVPLQVAGCHSENVIAFLRRTPSASTLVVLPRWLCRIADKSGSLPARIDWCDTHIVLPPPSPRNWKSILAPTELASQDRQTGACLMLNDLLNDFPVAFFQG